MHKVTIHGFRRDCPAIRVNVPPEIFLLKCPSFDDFVTECPDLGHSHSVMFSLLIYICCIQSIVDVTDVYCIAI